MSGSKNTPIVIVMGVVIILLLFIALTVYHPSCEPGEETSQQSAKTVSLLETDDPGAQIYTHTDAGKQLPESHTYEKLTDTDPNIIDFFHSKDPQLMFAGEVEDGEIEPSVKFNRTSRINVPINQEFQDTIADYETMTQEQQQNMRKQVNSHSALSFMPRRTAEAMNHASHGMLKLPSSSSNDENETDKALEANFQAALNPGEESDEEDDMIVNAVVNSAANQIKHRGFDHRHIEVAKNLMPGGAYASDEHLRPRIQPQFSEGGDCFMNGSQAHADAKEAASRVRTMQVR